MNTHPQTSPIQERKMKPNDTTLTRWAGLSAVVAGILYMMVGLFHPAETLATVTTARWIVVHVLASVMCFAGILGMAGLYARQAEKVGWAARAGFLLFSLWFVFMLGFTSVEAFVLPPLATTAPLFVEGFLGLFNGTASEVPLGVLPTLWLLTGPLYMLGGLLFGLATFRANILPRWAAGLFALGTALAPVAELLPHAQKSLVAVPVGLALVGLGYALWSERRAQTSETVPASASPLLRQAAAD